MFYSKAKVKLSNFLLTDVWANIINQILYVLIKTIASQTTFLSFLDLAKNMKVMTQTLIILT